MAERVAHRLRPRFYAEDVETGKWLDDAGVYVGLAFTPLPTIVDVTDCSETDGDPSTPPPFTTAAAREPR
jgi:hypothetical protein